LYTHSTFPLSAGLLAGWRLLLVSHIL
jgi:hypothetical protein